MSLWFWTKYHRKQLSEHILVLSTFLHLYLRGLTKSSASFLKSLTILHSYQQNGNFLVDLKPHIPYVVCCFSLTVFERCRVFSYVIFFFLAKVHSL